MRNCQTNGPNNVLEYVAHFFPAFDARICMDECSQNDQCDFYIFNDFGLPGQPDCFIGDFSTENHLAAAADVFLSSRFEVNLKTTSEHADHPAMKTCA